MPSMVEWLQLLEQCLGVRHKPVDLISTCLSCAAHMTRFPPAASVLPFGRAENKP